MVFNMTTGYTKEVKIMNTITTEEIAEIIRKSDGNYIFCLKNREILFLSASFEELAR